MRLNVVGFKVHTETVWHHLINYLNYVRKGLVFKLLAFISCRSQDLGRSLSEASLNPLLSTILSQSKNAGKLEAEWGKGPILGKINDP